MSAKDIDQREETQSVRNASCAGSRAGGTGV
jgi:hypothetical protein